jgi:hypothetical protein
LIPVHGLHWMVHTSRVCAPLCVKGDNEQENARVGLTVALPIDRRNSVKLNASTGIYTRTGSEFSLVGIAWQYRWGAGY